MLSSRATIYSAILFLSLSAGTQNLEYISAEAIFEDLNKWNARCVGRDSCQEDRRPPEDFSSVNCHCDRRCEFLGTCCADSKYRTSFGLGIGFSCYNPNGYLKFSYQYQGRFMLDRCRNWSGEDFVQDLCLGDAKALNDPLLLVPVTSSRTGISYRNYFCFACNEDLDVSSPVLWKLELSSYSKNVTGELRTNLQYDERTQHWKIRGTNVFVYLSAKIPEAFKDYGVPCEESVIQTCADNWTDLMTKQKCEAYMALVWKRGRLYRNPHCAVCNFLDVSEIHCITNQQPVGMLPPIVKEFYLDIENRCGRYEMYDPYSEKCRHVNCGEKQVWYQGECRDKI